MKDGRHGVRDLKDQGYEQQKEHKGDSESLQPFHVALALFIVWVDLILLPEHASASGCATQRHTCLSQLSQGTHGWRRVGVCI